MQYPNECTGQEGSAKSLPRHVQPCQAMVSLRNRDRRHQSNRQTICRESETLEHCGNIAGAHCSYRGAWWTCGCGPRITCRGRARASRRPGLRGRVTCKRYPVPSITPSLFLYLFCGVLSKLRTQAARGVQHSCPAHSTTSGLRHTDAYML